MKILLSLVSFLITSSSAEHEWSSFKEKHGKKYTNPNEESDRTKIFVDNLKMMKEHNNRYEAGLTPYKMTISRFFDKHPDELRAVMKGLNLTLLTVGRNDLGFRTLPSWVELPKSVDWRKEGAVTPVKDQGDSCGGCWAFSTTGALEAQFYRLTSKLVSLSEQQLIDCSGKYGNLGCDGGIMGNAFQYIKDNGGLATEESYPYQGKVGECRSEELKTLNGTAVKSFVDLPEGDERALLEAVATVGPVSVSVFATNPGFLWYGEGIFDGDTCPSKDVKVDHAVLIVGYGTENGTDYWIIKNSWGEGWGEKGYMRMVRGKGNICGITESSSYPLLTKQS